MKLNVILMCQTVATMTFFSFSYFSSEQVDTLGVFLLNIGVQN